MVPKISVIIPVYNAAEFLPDCINSLMQQSYNNLECIFVNDASTDESLQILNEFQKNYPLKMQVINLSNNMRQGAARNRGIETATGEYIGFVDADDFIAEDMYETLYSAITLHDSDIASVLYAHLPENARYSVVKKEINNLKPLYEAKEDLLRYNGVILDDYARSELIANSFAGAPCMLFSKKFLDMVQIAFPEGVTYEDNYWKSIIFSYLRKIEIVPKVKYIYRDNTSSTTRKNINFKDRIAMEELLQEDAMKRDILDNHWEAYEYLYTYRYAINTSMALLQRCFPPKILLVKHLYRNLTKKYPEWKQNRYYQMNFSEEEQKMHQCVLRHPSWFALISFGWKLNSLRREIFLKIRKG